MNAPPIHLHIALKVHELERSMAFYRVFFDLEADKVRPRFARFTVSSPPLVLTLNERRLPRRDSRISHLGVRVGSQEALDEARRRLTSAGLVDREEHRVHCCHAIENKLWAKDPDGNEWEVYVLVDDKPTS